MRIDVRLVPNLVGQYLPEIAPGKDIGKPRQVGGVGGRGVGVVGLPLVASPQGGTLQHDDDLQAVGTEGGQLLVPPRPSVFARPRLQLCPADALPDHADPGQPQRTQDPGQLILGAYAI